MNVDIVLKVCFRPLDQDEKSDEVFKQLRTCLLLGKGRWRNEGNRGHLLILMSYGRATEQDIRNAKIFGDCQALNTGTA